MAVTVTHSTVATLPDEPGAEVNKAEWNAAHTIVGLGTAAEAATTDFDAAGVATATVAAHESSPDPHPQYLTSTEGDAAYPPKNHDHTGAGQTLVPEAGLDILNAPGDRKILSYDGTSGKLEWATSTEYAATSLSLVVGTLNAGDVTSLQTWNDGNAYDFQEVSGTPGYDLQVTFDNVTTFNQVRTKIDVAEGTGSHKCEIAVWNKNTLAWDLLTSLRTTNGYIQADLDVMSASNYVDTTVGNGRVKVRFYHPISGVTSHQIKIEWMVLLDSMLGGGGISEHAALSGLDTAGSHPATAISNTPAGTIVATTVQAAIDELDTEKVATTRAINTTAPITGGGNLSADRTIAISDFVASGAGHARGAVPDPGAVAGTAKFLREDATWATPTGAGYSEVQDEGTPLTARAKLNFIGASVTAADNAGTGATDVTISAGGGLTMTTVEVDLGTKTKRAGKFNITTTGLTAGRPVLIVQANGPYTGKGTRTDEAEMDGLVVSGKTTSTTNIECFWKSATFVKGNFKFDYAVG